MKVTPRSWLVAAILAVAALAAPTSALAAAPLAETDSFHNIDATHTVLSGFVDPGGLNTDYHFEWAAASNDFCSDPTTGTHTDTATQQVLGSSTGDDVSAQITVAGGTDYCFRLVAHNTTA